MNGLFRNGFYHWLLKVSFSYKLQANCNKFKISRNLTGNIDQSQYCEKIKTIVEFIGNRIKNEEISALWEMQVLNFFIEFMTKFFFEKNFFLSHK